MTTSLLVTKTSKEDYLSLERVPYIYYPLCFQKDTVGIRALIDLGSKINVMTSVYTSKLGFKVYHTNVEAQKIDGSTLKIFGIVLVSFHIEDKISGA